MEDNYSTPVSPQSPNDFRTGRSGDWHKPRDIIEQLYRNDQLRLRDVKRIMERDYELFASNPSDMTCYTPDPTDEHSVTMPISPPPDMPSSTREMPAYPLGSYGKSTAVAVIASVPDDIDGRYFTLGPNHLENLPDLELEEGPARRCLCTQSSSHNVHSSHGPHCVHSARNSHTASGHPRPAPRDLEDVCSEANTRPPDWDTAESFQTRLQGLDFTLTQSMSKWARGQTPSHESPHNEGLGM
ncbi:unnamed protein product [Penicillium nalgiovense]|nr:unnamed protein product [Penicillium nalgiovense]